MRLEHYRREADVWVMDVLTHPAQHLEFADMAVALSMADAYRAVML